MRDWRVVVVGLTLLVAGGCTTGASPKHVPHAAARTSAGLGRLQAAPASCPAASAEHVGRPGVTVTSDAGALRAAGLVMSTSLPPAPGDDVKIVWRVTGRGRLGIATRGPGGERARVLFGPERHSGSNFDAPGDEWGTGWRFDRSGCWRFTFTRSGQSTSVVLGVAPR